MSHGYNEPFRFPFGRRFIRIHGREHVQVKSGTGGSGNLDRERVFGNKSDFRNGFEHWNHSD
jgi:hypothetical protein